MGRALTLPSTSGSFVASCVLHALAFAALLWSPKVSAPVGLALKSDIVEFEVGSAETAKQVSAAATAPVLSDEEGVAVPSKEKRQPAPAMKAAPAPRVGHLDGVSGSGELGDPDGIEASAQERYLHELTVALNQRKTYPLVSKRRGETGRVVVRFQLLRDGSIREPDLRLPSAHDRLNRAAVELVRGLRKFKPLPPEVTQAALSVEVPVDYVLQ